MEVQMAYNRKCEFKMFAMGTEMKFPGQWNRTKSPWEELCINDQLILTSKPGLLRKERMAFSTDSAGISTGQKRNLNTYFYYMLKN